MGGQAIPRFHELFIDFARIGCLNFGRGLRQPAIADCTSPIGLCHAQASELSQLTDDLLNVKVACETRIG